jgi:phosphosulfolactate phosphohydrolase-like enzyme
MEIHRLRPAQPFAQRVGAAVVMDVLRMTSTAAVLMRESACARVVVAGTPDDLERLSLRPSDCVIVSELSAEGWPGTWVDNSPALVSRMSFGSRTPVLVTTNGTRALFSAAAFANEVFLASFVDLHAVARFLRDRAFASVALVPAGHVASGELRAEDELCADALHALLVGASPDLEAMGAQIRADARVRRRVEAEPGFAADVELALEGDPRARVLKLTSTDPGVGHIGYA